MIRIFKRGDLDVILYGMLAAFAAACLARWSYLAELVTHFSAHFSLLGVLLCLMLQLTGAKRWKVVASAGIALVFALHVALALAKPREVARTEHFEDLTILQLNINFSHPDASGVAGWINNYATIDRDVQALAQHSQPDIVVLQEVSPGIAAKLASLERTYPYKILAPKAGAFGMVLYSRIPIRSHTRQHFPDSWNEYTQVQLHTLVQGIPITLTEAHTVPPIGKIGAVQRNAELRHLAQVIGQQNTSHKILIGDFNITPYSPWFRDLAEATKLTTAMRGKSILGTWPSFLPAMLRIPIDHLLLSGNIEVIEQRVEKNQGSDHLPVFTRLRLYKTE